MSNKSSTSKKSSKDESRASAAVGGQQAPASTGGTRARAASKKDTSALDARRRQNRIIGIAVIAVVAVLVVGAGWMFLSRPSGDVTAGTGGAAMAQGTVEQGNGGRWTNVSADTLAAMLAKKDFTFLNVKTPYIGEIEGTDLYIPYTDLAARASELPTDKAAPIVVYCRAGNESRVAAQALIDMGYTDIINLDGGMNAWTASGRPIVNKNRG
jgi:phage shock protein E